MNQLLLVHTSYFIVQDEYQTEYILICNKYQNFSIICRNSVAMGQYCFANCYRHCSGGGTCKLKGAGV